MKKELSKIKFIDNNPLETGLERVYGKSKFPGPKTVKEFNAAMEFIDERKLVSTTAEKRRINTVRKTKKIQNEKIREIIFNKSIEKSIKVFDKTLNLDSLEKVRYVKDGKGIIKFISDYKKGEVFQTKTVIEDILYTITLRNHNGKIQFSSQVIVPIPLEFVSLTGLTARFYYRRKTANLWSRMVADINIEVKKLQKKGIK